MLYTFNFEVVMDEVCQISLLLDFYGQLITKRQFDIMDLHYNNDCSFGEIAEQLNISRQGVYDNIKKGRQALNHLEEKLGMVDRFARHKNNAARIMEVLEEISPVLGKEDLQRLEAAKKAVLEIMED